MSYIVIVYHDHLSNQQISCYHWNEFNSSGNSVASTIAAAVVVTYSWGETIRLFARGKQRTMAMVILVHLVSHYWSCHLMINSFSAFCLRLQLIMLQVRVGDNGSMSALCCWRSPSKSICALAFAVAVTDGTLSRAHILLINCWSTPKGRP